MARLEALITKGQTGERDCAISGIEAIIDNLRLLDKIFIGTQTNHIFCNSISPENMIYFNSKLLFIPEALASKIAGEDYLELVDFVQILNDTRYRYKRILPKNFYKVLHITTPVEERDIDCLIINYRTIREISAEID